MTLSPLPPCSGGGGERIHWIGSMTLSPLQPVAGVGRAHTLDCPLDSLSAPPLAWCVASRIHLIGSMTLSPLHRKLS